MSRPPNGRLRAEGRNLNRGAKRNISSARRVRSSATHNRAALAGARRSGSPQPWACSGIADIRQVMQPERLSSGTGYTLITGTLVLDHRAEGGVFQAALICAHNREAPQECAGRAAWNPGPGAELQVSARSGNPKDYHRGYAGLSAELFGAGTYPRQRRPGYPDHRAEGDAWPPAGTSIPGASQRVPMDGHGLERDSPVQERGRSPVRRGRAAGYRIYFA